MAEEMFKDTKMKRRNAKANLTRMGKMLVFKVEGNHSEEEVRQSLKKVAKAYTELVENHDAFKQLIEEDEVFETEELWLDDCQQTFLRWETLAMEFLSAAHVPTNEQNEIHAPNEITENEPNPLPTYYLPVVNNSHSHERKHYRDYSEPCWNHRSK